MNHSPASILEKVLNSEGIVPSFLLLTSESEFERLNLARPMEILKDLGISGKKLEDGFFSSDFESSSAALEKLTNFLTHRPLYLKRKFIWWVVQADFQLSIQNKLLKTIEEAGDFYSFIFCKYSARPLLPTVESRLVTWRIRDVSHDKELASETENFTIFSATHFQEFQKKWEENKWSEKMVLESICKKALQNNSSFSFLEKFGQFLEWFNQSSQWNNPLIERKYMIFQYVRALS
ncbi:MAG: hypothetical protein QE271_03685 [Bacteriovoracaceae bacterium]|nr:hypothetical protein [Bacteriovoracaceae bacterium]